LLSTVLHEYVASTFWLCLGVGVGGCFPDFQQFVGPLQSALRKTAVQRIHHGFVACLGEFVEQAHHGFEVSHTLETK